MLPNSLPNMRASPESGGAVSGTHEMPEGQLERSGPLLDLQIARPLPFAGQPPLGIIAPLPWQVRWVSRLVTRSRRMYWRFPPPSPTLSEPTPPPGPTRFPVRPRPLTRL